MKLLRRSLAVLSVLIVLSGLILAIPNPYAVLAATPPVRGLANGGFEAGSLTGWAMPNAADGRPNEQMAVVTHDVPDRKIVMGIPARVVGDVPESELLPPKKEEK